MISKRAPGFLRPIAWPLAAPAADLIACLDRTVAQAARPTASLLLLLSSAVAAWWLYVPVHELLHAAACVVSGGTVRTLNIAPAYGGAFLAGRLPWVSAGGDHAGRLSDFSTGRSDLRYLAIDAAPYLLTVFAGVPLLRLCSRRRSPMAAGPALVLALAPFISVTGDYYEMGSILVTRATAPFDQPPEPWEKLHGFMVLRSDDLPALIGRLIEDGGSPAGEIPGGAPVAIAVVALAFIAGSGLALATYAAGGLAARKIFRLLGPASQEAVHA